MSYIDYRWARGQMGGGMDDELGRQIAATTRADPPFYGVVMLAMMRADTPNLRKLCRAWPAVYAEFQLRYDAPGAIIDSDPQGLRLRVFGEPPAAPAE